MRSKAWNGRRPPGSIFSVSFLDLLACTLGSLLFIMILLFMHTTNMIDPTAAPPAVRQIENQLKEATGAAAEQEKALDDAARQTAKVMTELASAKEEEKRLNELMGASPMDRERLMRGQVADVDAKLTAADKDLAELKRQLEEERAKRERVERTRQAIAKSAAEGRKISVPVRGSGNPMAANFTNIYHVICSKDGVAITHESATGASKAEGVRVPRGELKERASAFMAAVGDVRLNSKTHTMILWVRPDGLDTYSQAKNVADESKINVGDEPADADWELYIDRKEK